VYYLYRDSNNLQDIHALTNLIYLNYLPIQYNLLNTNSGSAAMNDIAVLQTHANVNYLPQRIFSLVPLVSFVNPVRLSATQFRFTIQSDPSVAVRLWSSTDLNTWTLMGTLTNTTGSTNFTDTTATSATKYYKAR
jgi:hypothetical protein